MLPYSKPYADARNRAADESDHCPMGQPMVLRRLRRCSGLRHLIGRILHIGLRNLSRRNSVVVQRGDFVFEWSSTSWIRWFS
jgi:hypothetical protein